MTGKGDTYRKVKWREFGTNYDRIFGALMPRLKKKEYENLSESNIRRVIEQLNAKQLISSEGSMRYAEYRIQYPAHNG